MNRRVRHYRGKYRNHGRHLAALLVEQGWTVYGLARRPTVAAGVIRFAADLRIGTLLPRLTGIGATHVFSSLLASTVNRSGECQ